MAENAELQPSTVEGAAATVKKGLAVAFYNGGCPLCRREIRHYRSLRGAETLRWIDITQDQSALGAYDLPLDEAMARFHVLGADGR